MAVSVSSLQYCWPLLFGLFFVFCGCTERKISPDLTTWKAEIEKQIHHLQKDSQETHLANQNLVTKVELLEHKLMELESEKSKMEEIIEKQNERLRLLDSLSTTQKKIDNSEDPLMSHEQRTEENEYNRVQRLIGPTAQPAEPIAFHSHLSTSSLPNLSKHHVIIFDSNPVNKGHGYHKDNGIFEAPRAGTYVLVWTLYTYPRGIARTELLVNGNVVGGALVDSHPDDGIQSSTGLVITDLGPGDHVYVRLSYTAINYILSYQDGRSTFSGWLLH